VLGAETVTVTVWVTAVPLAGVTVRVYLVVAVGLTVTAVPLVAGRLPGVMTPVPPVNVPVSIELPPGEIVMGTAVKLLMLAAGFTVMVTVAVTAAPLAGVTVSVYVVVAVGLTVTAVPVVAGRLPGVIRPVPPLKTPVRVVLCPSVMVAEPEVKLVITGTTGGVLEEPPPPQPVIPTMATLTATAQETRARNFFMKVSSTNELCDLSACP
jgi:hypothetical protein